MTPNNRQSKWDIYEAVILLDGYLEVLRGNQLRAHIVKRVSADLRQMAVNRGFEINESYRNENGISYQIQSMDSAFKGEKVSVPATKIFDEAVILYRTDKRRYSEIFEKAKNMIEATHNNKFEEMKNASEEADKYPELIKCDFTNYQEFAYTIPAYCSIAGVRFQEKTWSRVLVALTQNELDNHNPAMENLYQTSLMSGGRGQPYLMEERNDLRCKQLSNGYWVCTNYNIPDLIKMIVTLCLRCGYTKEQVVLYGAPKYTATGAKTYLDKAGEFNGAIVPKEKTSRENPLPLPVGQPESLESAKTVDFDANLDYSGTKPFFLSYFDEEIDFNHSWSGMYVVLAKCLYEDYPHIFKELSNDFTAGISPAIVASSAEKNRFIRPVAVCAEYVLETNKSATNIVHNIKIILDKCNVDYENIVIRLETTTSQKPSGSQNAGISFYEWLVKIRRLPEAKALIYDSSIDDFCEKRKVDTGRLYDNIDSFISLLTKDANFQYNQLDALLKYGDFIKWQKKSENKKHTSALIPNSATSRREVSTEEAEKFLRSAGLGGATAEEIIAAVQPDAARSSTVAALNSSLKIIAMPDGRYVHADSFTDLDEAEEVMSRILKAHFAQFDGYSNDKLLYGAASQEMPMFFNENDCGNIKAAYAIARFLFEKKAVTGSPYKFSSPHIFEKEPDYPMNLQGLMIHFARSRNGILYVSDAEEYLQKILLSGNINQILHIGYFDNTFLIYDSKRYILSEQLRIDEAWCKNIHDRLDDLFRKNNVAYVIPRDIHTEWLRTLPYLPDSLAWTPLLLQELLKKYTSIGFKAISAGSSRSATLAAAFVPMDSPLQSFPDVVTLFMEEHHNLPMRMAGEDLRLELRDAGMLQNNEMISTLHKALNDYRFAWSDENKTVYVIGNSGNK